MSLVSVLTLRGVGSERLEKVENAQERFGEVLAWVRRMRLG